MTIKIKTVILNSNNMSHYYCFYCISDQICAALVSRRDFQMVVYIYLPLFSCICNDLFFLTSSNTFLCGICKLFLSAV